MDIPRSIADYTTIDVKLLLIMAKRDRARLDVDAKHLSSVITLLCDELDARQEIKLQRNKEENNG